MAFEIPKSLKSVVDFAIHVLVGSVAFLIVFVAAVAISQTVKALGGMVPPWVEQMTQYAEGGLYVLDLALFALFIISEAIRLVRELVRGWQE